MIEGEKKAAKTVVFSFLKYVGVPIILLVGNFLIVCKREHSDKA
jgi:hypothetical protein